MFSSFPLFALDIDDYNNKKVIVGYNKEKDDLIVIKKCENVWKKVKTLALIKLTYYNLNRFYVYKGEIK